MECTSISRLRTVAVFIQDNGYKTTAAKFGMMASNAMAKDERFKRMGRGLYKRVK